MGALACKSRRAAPPRATPRTYTFQVTAPPKERTPEAEHQPQEINLIAAIQSATPTLRTSTCRHSPTANDHQKSSSLIIWLRGPMFKHIPRRDLQQRASSTRAPPGTSTDTGIAIAIPTKEEAELLEKPTQPSIQRIQVAATGTRGATGRWRASARVVFRPFRPFYLRMQRGEMADLISLSVLF